MNIERIGCRTGRQFVAATCAIVLASAAANAQTEKDCANEILFQQDVQLSLIYHVEVLIDDQIGDGCWPRPSASKTVVELELINQNINVVDEEVFLRSRLNLRGLGFGTLSEKSYCVARLELKLDRPLSAVVPYSTDYASRDDDLARNIAYYPLWTMEQIISGSKSDFQDRIKSFFEEAAEALVLDYRKSQAWLFETCPEIKKRFEEAIANDN